MLPVRRGARTYVPMTQCPQLPMQRAPGCQSWLGNFGSPIKVEIGQRGNRPEKSKGRAWLLMETRLLPRPAGGDKQGDVMSQIPFADPFAQPGVPPAWRGSAESAKRRYNGVWGLLPMACGALRLTGLGESAV